MLSRVRRALWRFEVRALGFDRLALVIEEVLDRCVEQRHRLPNASPDLLRRVGGDLFVELDKAIETTLRYLGDQKATEAAESTYRVVESLRVVQLLARASLEFEKASSRQSEWSGELSLEKLSDLPQLTILTRILDKAHQCLELQDFRKSLALCRFIDRWMNTLSTISDSATPEVEELIERIEARADRTATTVILHEQLESLRNLLNSGYPILARRLAEELEVKYWGWRATRNDSQSESNVEKISKLNEIGEQASTLNHRISIWLSRPARHFEDLLN